MGWKDFTEKDGTVRTYYYSGATVTGLPELKHYYVKFQYDTDNHTPTKLRCRAICYNDTWKSNGYGTDYLYLYIPGKVYTNGDKTAYTDNFLIHDGDERKIPQATSEFWLFKPYDDEHFKLDKFWICVQGRQGTLGKFSHSYFDPDTGTRKNFVTKFTSDLPKHDGWTPPSLGKGTVQIQDNLNNSIVISGTLPPDATYSDIYGKPNKLTGATLKYTINTDSEQSTNLTDTEIKNRSFTRTINDLTNKPATYTVSAKIECKGTYNNTTNTGTNNSVHCYTYPKQIARADITVSTFKDAACTKASTKLTPKSFIKISWPRTNQRNDVSPNNACRMYLFAKKKSTPNKWDSYGETTDSKTYNKGSNYYKYTIIKYDAGRNGTIQVNNGSTYDTDRIVSVSKSQNGNTITAVISAEGLGLAHGDTFAVGLRAFHTHTDRSNTWRYWSNGMATEPDYVDVKNAATMLVASTDSDDNLEWSECSTYVCTGLDDSGNAIWKEASSLYIKVSDSTWKESI